MAKIAPAKFVPSVDNVDLACSALWVCLTDYCWVGNFRADMTQHCICSQVGFATVDALRGLFRFTDLMGAGSAVYPSLIELGMRSW